MLFFLESTWGFLLDKFDIERLKDRIPSYCMAMGVKLNLPNPEEWRIWGFVDGTVRFHCKPEDPVAWAVHYNGYKHTHAFKYQAITSVCGIIEHMAGPFEGRQNDAWGWEWSCVGDEDNEGGLASFCKREDGEVYSIYGDAGYVNSKFLQCPYKRYRLTEDQLYFNACMARVRVSVEMCFGLVVNIWRGLSFKMELRSGLQPLGRIYRVFVLLTNCLTCMNGSNQISTYFSCPPPTITEYLRPRNGPSPKRLL
jgi:hypothetical protein